MAKLHVEKRFDLGKETLDKVISREFPEYAPKSLAIAYEIYSHLYTDQKKEEKLSAAYIKALNNAVRIEIHVNGIDKPDRTYERTCGVFELRKEKEGALAIDEDDGYNIEEFAKIKLS